MHWKTTFLLLPLLALLLAGGVGADEDGDAQAPADTSPADLIAHALEVLQTRMDAELRMAEILREAGRTQEALEHLQQVGPIYDRGMARIEGLVEHAGSPTRPPRAIGVGGGTGAGPFHAPNDVTGPESGGGRGAFGGRGKHDSSSARSLRDPVENALRWLAAHQSPDGRWAAHGFNRWCDGKEIPDGPDGLGKDVYDPGVTGLALCAFLGAGYTNRGRHPFAKVVAKGLRWLKTVQDADGCFGPRTSQHCVYNHAIASLAMTEAYGMTESPIFKGSAQRALDFIALARNPYFAWRYGVRPGENDTSVTGWMTMALKSASLINEDAKARGRKPPLVIDDDCFDGARVWIDKMTDPDDGRVGYIQRGGLPARPQELIDKFPAEKSESMTSVGVLLRIFLGEDPRTSDIVQKGARLCAAKPPKWDLQAGSIDMYYWYYGTLALFQVGGDQWRTWNRALQTAVGETQRQDTDFCRYKGSWDPAGPWGPDGGRVYSTAMLAMCLEVYDRYDRVFGTH